MSTILKVFNTHFMEFCEDISKVFPENKEIQKVKFAVEILQKTKPRIIIEYWKLFSSNYTEEINEGNLNFFINHNYQDEIKYLEADDNIGSYLDKFREPMKEMGDENREKCITYIQNLTKMSNMYTK